MYKRVFLFLALFIQITSLYSMEPEVDAVPADQRAAPVAAEQPQPAKSDKKECLPGLFSNSALVPSLCFLAARQLFLKEERALELYCATDAPELRELIKNVPFHMKEYLRKYCLIALRKDNKAYPDDASWAKMALGSQDDAMGYALKKACIDSNETIAQFANYFVDCNSTREHVFIELLKSNNLKAARTFCRCNIVNLSDKFYSWPILHEIIQWPPESWSRQALRFMLGECKADPNAKDDKNGDSLLGKAAATYSGYIPILLHFGADKEQKNDQEFTPAMTAFYFARAQAFKILADAGADINFKLGNEQVPLIEAAKKRHEQMGLPGGNDYREIIRVLHLHKEKAAPVAKLEEPEK